MPNYCTNQLYLKNGNSIFPLLDSYINPEKDNILDFQKIIPYPEGIAKSTEYGVFLTTANLSQINEEEKKERENQHNLLLESNLKEYGYKDWYDWSVENWGTKWNADQGGASETGMCFCTAWSPCIPIVCKLAELTGETFILEYMEEGEGFIGRYTATPTGDDEEEYYEDFDQAPQELKDKLGYEEYEDEDDE